MTKSATYYTKQHEWMSLEGDLATVGITRFAADALGDLVFIDVKPVGAQVKAEEAVAVVESVKAASDIYAPISGEIVEVNPLLADEPSLMNDQPETDGWLFKLRVAGEPDFSQLLDKAAYAALVGPA